jgi:hypothetical protein
MRGTRRTRSRLAWLGLVALGVTACSTPAGADTEKKKATPMSKPSSKDILDRVAQIAEGRPFDPAEVGKLTGHTLKKVNAGSNEYFTVYRSDTDASAPIFASVEVRAPTAKSAGKGGMVLLDVAAECVNKEDVGDRFGKPASTVSQPPRHGMPADSPDYVAYRQAWGAVKLGFSRKTGCLVKAVIDATE